MYYYAENDTITEIKLSIKMKVLKKHLFEKNELLRGNLQLLDTQTMS
jgi:hypothetical protein